MATKTLITRFGKIRCASQRRYILLGVHCDAASPTGALFVSSRSDDPSKLHAIARRKGNWSIDRQAVVVHGLRTETLYVVIDQVTGDVVAR